MVIQRKILQPLSFSVSGLGGFISASIENEEGIFPSEDMHPSSNYKGFICDINRSRYDNSRCEKVVPLDDETPYEMAR